MIAVEMRDQDHGDFVAGEAELRQAGYRYLLVGEVTARREWRVFVLKKEQLKIRRRNSMKGLKR